MKIENFAIELSLEEKNNIKTPSRCPFMQAEQGIKLMNYTSGAQSIDTLHSLSEVSQNPFTL